MGILKGSSFYGREDDHKAMIVHDDGGQPYLVFICMQIASAIASPANVHRVGNFAIGFVHEWIRVFLVHTGAPRHDIFPPFTATKDSLLYGLLTKDGSQKITQMLHKDELLPRAVQSTI